MRTIAIGMIVALAASCLGDAPGALAADCGCGSPGPSCCYHRHHCRKCCPCGSDSRDEGRSRGDVARSYGTPTTILPYMPVFAMPVVPYAARASYEYEGRGMESRSSSMDRITQIEMELKEVRASIRNLQFLIEGQMDVMQKLQEKCGKDRPVESPKS